MKVAKLLLLACIALGAVSFTIPAVASAEPLKWTHEGEPIDESTVIELSGNAGFAIAGVMSFACNVHTAMKAEPGQTGQLTRYDVTTNTCAGVGALSGCEIALGSTSGLPWTVHTTTTDFEITDMTVHAVYKPGCPIATTSLHFPSMTTQPNNSEAISDVTISGTATTGIVTFGKLEVVGEDAGTYGIG